MNYSYTSTTKPGKSDPYWYEWSVGEKYLLDMLYEESNIEAVAFQGNISLGLDDVVVYYKDESIKCIQVKHIRLLFHRYLLIESLVRRSLRQKGLMVLKDQL